MPDKWRFAGDSLKAMLESLPMIVETRVWIIVRLVDLGRQLTMLKKLSPAERSKLARPLRVERRRLMKDLALSTERMSHLLNPCRPRGQQ